MKDFIKWLGVNEKVAKVAVWLLIIMIFLIVTNTMLESLGLPNYVITYDNLVKLDVNRIIDTIVVILVCFLNFYSITLLVFRINEIKKLFKYSLLYLMLNGIVYTLFGFATMQVFIFLFDIVFCYLYSGKKAKYILYAIVSYIIVVLVQGIWYTVKARFIDFDTLNYTTRSILSLNYYIIMTIIIPIMSAELLTLLLMTTMKENEKNGNY